MWQTKEWLENAIRTHDNEKMVQKILSLSGEPAVPVGENYTSELIRLTTDVITGSGQIIKKSFILKVIPEAPIRRLLAQSTGIFHTEIKIFKTILKEMEKLMESVQDWREPLWGECLMSDIQKGILFQDLRPLGYKVADRKKGLDIEHAKAVLTSLARFHAMSVILYEKYVFRKEDFSVYVFANAKDEMIQKFAVGGLRTLGEVISTTWPKQWNDVGNRIKSVSTTYLERLSEISSEENCEFKVLNHGDLWVNNMMFKYDVENGNICGVRFIDFQLSHWNSPAFDIQYLLRTSLRSDQVTLHYEDLLSCYHMALVKTFKFMGHEPKVMLSLNQLHCEMDRTVIMGFFAAACVLPTIVADKDDIMNVEDVLSANEKSASEGLRKTYMGESYTKVMKNMLPFFQNKGIF